MSDKDVSKSVTAIGEVADELWSDEQYDQMSEEEKQELSKDTTTEDEIVNDLIKTIDANFKTAKIKKPDAFYKFGKIGKCDGKVKVFTKTNNFQEGLKTNITSQHCGYQDAKMDAFKKIVVKHLKP